MVQIANKVVWITGASSGIGEALSYELSNRGCRLIISSRNTEKLKQVMEGCSMPGKVAMLPLDLAAFNEMPSKVERATNIFGHIDILINNAGISQRSLILTTEFEVFQRLMDLNYLGAVALTKAILPQFIAGSGGHIVAVTSLMGKFGSPYRSGYCGAKHALHGFFDVLRMEHEHDAVKVTLICPGFVQTNIARNSLTADGSPKKTNDPGTEKGMPVARFVKKMIRAIERQKYEAYIGGKEIKGIYLKRFFPKLLHRVVLRSQVR